MRSNTIYNFQILTKILLLLLLVFYVSSYEKKYVFSSIFHRCLNIFTKQIFHSVGNQNENALLVTKALICLISGFHENIPYDILEKKVNLLYVLYRVSQND